MFAWFRCNLVKSGRRPAKFPHFTRQHCRIPHFRTPAFYPYPGVCKYYISPIGNLSLSTAMPQPPARNRPSMYSFFAQKWYGLLSFWALSWLRARMLYWVVVGWYTEAVGGGGGFLVSNNCFLQQNTTASLLELYFNDSMQTAYARGGGGSQQTGRQWADGADVVFTDTG